MNIQWDAETYSTNFDFVPQYGEAVMNLLTVQNGGRVVDLGCGNGRLTAQLRQRGYKVLGIDASASMLDQARKDYPDLMFALGDAVTFRLETPCDAIFSNAVLHWIDKDRHAAMLHNIAGNLKTGGEFVFECGGRGCAETVHSTLEDLFTERRLNYPRVFYFPTIGEYAPRMEQCGLRVTYAALFDRPTPQVGPHGGADWIRMFVQRPFDGMAEQEKEDIIHEAERRMAAKLLKNGTWVIDYVRLRMRAVKL